MATKVPVDTESVAYKTYQAVRAKIEAGVPARESFAQVASETGRSAATVQSTYYQTARRLPGGGGVAARPRKRRKAAAAAAPRNGRRRRAAKAAAPRRGARPPRSCARCARRATPSRSTPRRWAGTAAAATRPSCARSNGC